MAKELIGTTGMVPGHMTGNLLLTGGYRIGFISAFRCSFKIKTTTQLHPEELRIWKTSDYPIYSI